MQLFFMITIKISIELSRSIFSPVEDHGGPEQYYPTSRDNGGHILHVFVYVILPPSGGLHIPGMHGCDSAVYHIGVNGLPKNKVTTGEIYKIIKHTLKILCMHCMASHDSCGKKFTDIH